MTLFVASQGVCMRWLKFAPGGKEKILSFGKKIGKAITHGVVRIHKWINSGNLYVVQKLSNMDNLEFRNEVVTTSLMYYRVFQNKC